MTNTTEASVLFRLDTKQTVCGMLIRNMYLYLNNKMVFGDSCGI